MATNQEARQLSIRDSTSTAGMLNEDWHALFDDAGVAAGTFNERMLAWINERLSASYASLPEAMQAFAADQGYSNWSSMGVIVLDTVIEGPGGVGSPIGLLMALTKAA